MPSRKLLSSIVIVITCALFMCNVGIVDAVTQDDLYSIRSYTPFYDPDEAACGASGSIVVTQTGTTALNQAQATNAQTIIGIAKTENLGQAGALVALMVGLDESHLLNLSNTQNVPLSKNSPDIQGNGANGMSLGVFQQQITDNWSTLGSDPNNQAAVNQLMTPSYAAEAFFGSPAGSNANSALQHGLQNVANWQSMQPWVAAQAVQRSSIGNGSNYEAWLNDAQSLLTKYWSGAVAIPLPVALNATGGGGTTTGAAVSGCAASTQCASGATGDAKILCAAQAWTRIWYAWGGGHQGRTAYVAGCPNPADPPANPPNIAHSPNVAHDGNPNACAVDCSGLVSMAVDAAFDQTFDWVVADITQSPDWKQVPIPQAQPGDVVTVGTEHVEIFVSYDAGTVHTFGAHETGTQTGTAVAAPGYYDAAYQYIGPGAD